MNRMRAVVAVGCGLFVAWVARPGRAQTTTPTFELTALPVTVIGLDTSGSMEYTDVDGVVPSCGTLSGVSPARNRWATALEVLTGTFQSPFACTEDDRTGAPLDRTLPVGTVREDKDYPVPHIVYHVPGTGPTALSTMPAQPTPNGIIDVFDRSIKFALATFDSDFCPGFTRNGMWSYGPIKLLPPNVTMDCGLGPQTHMNLGIKTDMGIPVDADPSLIESYIRGRLIPPVLSDDDSTVSARNQIVEKEILAAIPFGGTPISPMLADLYHWYATDPRVCQSGTATCTTGGDPFWDCRERAIILVTDGLPTEGEECRDNAYLPANLTVGQCQSFLALHGYTNIAAKWAQKLYEDFGVRTFVVGFALQNNLVPAVLDDIAVAGDPLNPGASAFLANNATQLKNALTVIVNSTLQVESQTEPVFTNITRNASDAQYEFRVAWGPTPDHKELRGFLDQVIYRCTSACRTPRGGAGQCEVFSVSDAIDAHNTISPGTTWAVVDGKLELFSAGNTNITADLLGVPAVGDGVPLYDPTNPTGPPIGLSSDPVVRAALRTKLIDHLLARAGSRREGIRFGAVRHGTPVVLERPAGIASDLPSFKAYAQAHKGRPTVLFVPTHVGEVMAIRVDRASSLQPNDYGKHLWSVVPNTILPRFHEMVDSTPFLLDAPLTVRDILLQRQSINPNVDTEKALWRSVLFVPFGTGGRGVLALDVTDPTAPKFLWEINSERRCYRSGVTATCEANSAQARSNFCYLGYVDSKVVAGNVFLKDYQNVPRQQRAVAVIAGGTYSGPGGLAPNGCGTFATFDRDDIGKSVFIVDVKTGAIIEEFHPGAPNVVDPMPDRIVGEPACFNTAADAIMTRCFVGDAGGRLWRIDLSSGDHTKWKMSLFYDLYADPDLSGSTRAPIYTAPALALEPNTGNLVVVVGTGFHDLQTTIGPKHAVFSLMEQTSFDATTGLITNVSAALKWKKVFTDGTQIVGSPVVFDKVAYFATFTPDPSNACNLFDDSAKLWGFHYFKHDPNISGNTTPVPKLIDPTQVDNLNATPVDHVAIGPVKPSAVSIILRPSCVAGSPLDYDPLLGSSTDSSVSGSSTLGGTGGGAGDVEVVVPTSGKAPEAQTGGAGGAGTTSNQEKVPTFKARIRRPPTTVHPLTWGLILD